MGSESEQEYCHDDLTSTTPKLSLYSLPSKALEPPGLTTPPIKTLASVPFQWEEAPGKPRACCAGGASNGDNKPKSVVRCLELPPRLLVTEAKLISGMPSPTTVFDGPYSGGLSLSFRKGRSFRSPEKKERVMFGSSRWGSFKKNNKEVVSDHGVGGGFDFLFSDVKGDAGEDRDGTKVKITRVKRRSISFRSNISQTKSHNLLTSIYESFKQVVPLSWSRRSFRQEKLRKMGS